MSDLRGQPNVTVRVPATSANLGPGFDALGLALDTYDEVTAAPADRIVISVTGEGAGEVAIDESHLVVEAIRAAFAEVGVALPRSELTCTNVIPHSREDSDRRPPPSARGYKPVSRSRCAGDPAAGVRARLPDRGPSGQRRGLCLRWRHHRLVRPAATSSGPLAALPAIAAVTFVPQARTSTKASRGTLPEQVSHRDAAATAARAALLIHGLTSDPAVLLDATQDWLHQPYRLPGLPAQQALVTALRAADIPAVLSGSGPTVLALARNDAEVERAIASPVMTSARA